MGGREPIIGDSAILSVRHGHSSAEPEQMEVTHSRGTKVELADGSCKRARVARPMRFRERREHATEELRESER